MKCYLCSSPSLEIIRRKLRGDVRRNVLRCKKCSLVYLAPKKADIETHYRTEYRKTNSPTVGKQLTSKEIFDIYLPFQRARVDKIRHILRKDMRVLDIGASSGHFLSAIKRYVGECVALEFNQSDVGFIKKNLRFAVYDTPIEKTDLPQKYFDLITIFQTLEHIEDPISFLKTVSKYLKRGGYLVVEVPNENEALYTIYDSIPYADFNHKEAHLFYFIPATLKKVLNRAGFHGNIQSIQRVNFLNHLHWIYAERPQAGPHIHMAPAKLVDEESVSKKCKSAACELNVWIKRVDRDYRNILNKHGIGESILFIGKKEK